MINPSYQELVFFLAPKLRELSDEFKCDVEIINFNNSNIIADGEVRKILLTIKFRNIDNEGNSGIEPVKEISEKKEETECNLRND